MSSTPSTPAPLCLAIAGYWIEQLSASAPAARPFRPPPRCLFRSPAAAARVAQDRRTPAMHASRGRQARVPPRADFAKPNNNVSPSSGGSLLQQPGGQAIDVSIGRWTQSWASGATLARGHSALEGQERRENLNKPHCSKYRGGPNALITPHFGEAAAEIGGYKLRSDSGGCRSGSARPDSPVFVRNGRHSGTDDKPLILSRLCGRLRHGLVF